jgi:hypothetical protein
MGIPQAANSPARRRSDAGRVRLQQRDLDGLLLIADHYAAPYDLLAQALGASPARVRSITARWRVVSFMSFDRACSLVLTALDALAQGSLFVKCDRTWPASEPG